MGCLKDNFYFKENPRYFSAENHSNSSSFYATISQTFVFINFQKHVILLVLTEKIGISDGFF